MRYVARSVFSVLMVLLVTACHDSKRPACASASDCQDGYSCIAGVCEKLCLTQLDCGETDVCRDGLCHTRTGGPLPEVVTVEGNASSDPARVQNGLIVRGRALTKATFELRSEASAVSLVVPSQSDEQAEVLLPTDVRHGLYKLAATNDAGTAFVSVTLELPELSGDLLIDRINQQATTSLSSSVMPANLLSRLAALEAAAATAVHKGDGVYAYYVASKGYTLGTGTVMGFSGKVYDTDNAVTVGDDVHTTWSFKVPAGKGGLYHLTTHITFLNQGTSAADVAINAEVNGSAYQRIWRNMINPGVPGATASFDVMLDEGDLLDLLVALLSGGPVVTESASIEIHRVLGY